jgi:maltose alpha-D-glucosyltransferase/alpha-amylase
VPWRIDGAEGREQLETEVLPRYLAAQLVRREGENDQARGSSTTRCGTCAARLARHPVEVEGGAEAARYLLPLALAWEDRDEAAPEGVARRSPGRQRANVGVMSDAFADGFLPRGGQAIRRGASLRPRTAPCASRRPRRSGPIAGGDFAALPVGRQAQSSNTVITIASGCSSRLPPAAGQRQPELGWALPTEVAGFKHCVPVAGAFEYVGADGTPMTIALLQAYVVNQGDGWAHARLPRAAPETQRARRVAAGDVPAAICRSSRSGCERRAAWAFALQDRRRGSTRSRSPANVAAWARIRAAALDLLEVQLEKLRPRACARRARSGARPARRPAAEDRRRRRPAGRARQDALPRRLSPRPGARLDQRLRDHRLRRRAEPPALAAPASARLRDVAGMIRSSATRPDRADRAAP